MWDYDGFIGKARMYFGRAAAVPANDDAFGVWMLLGLEFLLRAPLARKNPALLADPQDGNGEALLQAVGIPASPNATSDPKSIPASTVNKRLVRLVDQYTSEMEKDAVYLFRLRNMELHTSGAAVAEASVPSWLPKFIKITEVICSHLDLDPKDIVGDEVMKYGRSLVSEQNKKLEHEIGLRIKAAKALLAGLMPEEIAARVTVAERMHRDGPVDECPSCERGVVVVVEPVRVTNERLQGDDIAQDVISIARSFECIVCGLKLNSTAEIIAAGLTLEHTSSRTESFYDRYIAGYEPDDYGND